MKVILPVAGKGERMRPYTNNLPKCLLPIGVKTIIDWIVPPPLRRFGVAVTDANGNISKLVEKPQEFVSDEAIAGIYYIKDVKELKAALKHLMDNDIRTKGDFPTPLGVAMASGQCRAVAA